MLNKGSVKALLGSGKALLRLVDLECGLDEGVLLAGHLAPHHPHLLPALECIKALLRLY